MVFFYEGELPLVQSCLQSNSCTVALTAALHIPYSLHKHALLNITAYKRIIIIACSVSFFFCYTPKYCPFLPNLLEEESIKLCSPIKRHMSISLSKPGTPSCYRLPIVKTDAWSKQSATTAISSSCHGSKRKQVSSDDTTGRHKLFPLNGLSFLTWFTTLEKGIPQLL